MLRGSGFDDFPGVDPEPWVDDCSSSERNWIRTTDLPVDGFRANRKFKAARGQRCLDESPANVLRADDAVVHDRGNGLHLEAQVGPGVRSEAHLLAAPQRPGQRNAPPLDFL